MNSRTDAIINEIEKVIIGKRNVVERVLMAILSEGHILLDDVPGTGKTTLALTCSVVMGVQYQRMQFTPDVVPSDIVGFSVYNKATGGFDYKPGVVMTNLLLADEINRTSSKTQSALLEVMEEGQVTVDGVTHQLPKPFVVIATQNPVGSAGTQLLPQAQLDRFVIRLQMGYPDYKSQVDILRDRQKVNFIRRFYRGFKPHPVQRVCVNQPVFLGSLEHRPHRDIGLSDSRTGIRGGHAVKYSFAVHGLHVRQQHIA